MVDHGFEDLTFAATVERLTDFACLTDQVGTVRYVNPFGVALLGCGLDELVGRSVIELLHPDDVSRAVIAVARTMDVTRDIPITPAFFRLRRADGSFVRMEVNGTAFEDADGRRTGVVFLARPTTEADLHDDLMDLLTTDAPSAKAFELVPEFGRWRQPDLLHAVFYLDDDGAPTATGDPALVGIGGPDHHWAALASLTAFDGPLVVAVDDLAPELADRARQGGLTHLRIQPVWDPLHRRHVVVALGQDVDHPNTGDAHVLEMTSYVLDNTARVLGLVVAWRHQVLELRRAASTDALTGLANRTGFWAALQRHRDAERDDSVGMLFIDLDHFKAVNDNHGHAVGDALLVEVADRLRQVVRPGDTVARMGGDEFAVLLPGLSRPTVDTSAVATRLVEVLGEPVVVDGRSLPLGASVGVATAPTVGLDPEHLLETADRALYQAKATGRGRWHLDDASAAS